MRCSATNEKVDPTAEASTRLSPKDRPKDEGEQDDDEAPQQQPPSCKDSGPAKKEDKDEDEEKDVLPPQAEKGPAAAVLMSGDLSPQSFPPYSRRHIAALINLGATLSNLSEIERRRCEEALANFAEATRAIKANLRWRRSQLRREGGEGKNNEKKNDNREGKDSNGKDEDGEEKKQQESPRDSKQAKDAGYLNFSPEEIKEKEEGIVRCVKELWEYHRNKVDRVRAMGTPPLPSFFGFDGMPPTGHIVFAPDQCDNRGGTKCRYNTFFENDIGVLYFQRSNMVNVKNADAADNGNEGESKGEKKNIRVEQTMQSQGQDVQDKSKENMQQHKHPGNYDGSSISPVCGVTRRFVGKFPLSAPEAKEIFAPLCYSTAMLAKEGSIESCGAGGDGGPAEEDRDELSFRYFGDVMMENESSKKKDENVCHGRKEQEQRDNKDGQESCVSEQQGKCNPPNYNAAAAKSSAPQPLPKMKHRRRYSAPPKLNWDPEDEEEVRASLKACSSKMRRSISFVKRNEYFSTSAPSPPSGPQALHGFNDLLEEVHGTYRAKEEDIEPTPKRETDRQRLLHDYVMILYNVGLCYHRMGDNAVALRMFESAHCTISDSGADEGRDGIIVPRPAEVKDAMLQLLAAQAMHNAGQLHAAAGRHWDARVRFQSALGDAVAALRLFGMSMRRREVFDALNDGNHDRAINFVGMLVQTVRCIALAYSNIGRYHFLFRNYGAAMVECHNAVELLHRFLSMFPLLTRPGKPLFLSPRLAMAIRYDIAFLVQNIVLIQRGIGGLERMDPRRAFHYVGWTCLNLLPRFTVGLVREFNMSWGPPVRAPPMKALEKAVMKADLKKEEGIRGGGYESESGEDWRLVTPSSSAGEEADSGKKACGAGGCADGRCGCGIRCNIAEQ